MGSESVSQAFEWSQSLQNNFINTGLEWLLLLHVLPPPAAGFQEFHIRPGCWRLFLLCIFQGRRSNIQSVACVWMHFTTWHVPSYSQTQAKCWPFFACNFPPRPDNSPKMSKVFVTRLHLLGWNTANVIQCLPQVLHGLKCQHVTACKMPLQGPWLQSKITLVAKKDWAASVSEFLTIGSFLRFPKQVRHW